MISTSREHKDRETKGRDEMINQHLKKRGIEDTLVLEAMRSVPREAFLPEGVDDLAYADMPLPIDCEQTISQPFIVAWMAQLAEINPDDKVLEIGAGSGYGAAILSRVAREVFSIERHKKLAMRAENILADLEYDNVSIVNQDGSVGLAEEAPFDAIIVTAGSPDVPAELKKQLAPGGRLVIPVGADERRQHLLRVTHTQDGMFETEDFGPVAFVPLIGEKGWGNGEKPASFPGTNKESSNTPGNPEKELDERSIVKMLERGAQPLPEPESPHFGEFFDHLSDADIVLLGEGTHGTAEFYRARAAITQHLIRNHGFNIVALEADYPDAALLDGYVRDRDVPDMGQPAFARFPQWMWRNEEFRQLVSWMKTYNDRQSDAENKAGIYGLDLYSLQSSINAVIDFLDKKDPELADIARTRYGCFEPWADNPAGYGRSVLLERMEGCEQDVVNMLMELMEQRKSYMNGYADNFLDMTRNAELIANAEKYYRVMYLGSAESWNLRDRHMFNTLRAIIKGRHETPDQPKPKAIVWAHNSHIGDARATEMGKARGELNLGQLCRQNYGDKARLVGFGTANGNVAAADDWGGDMNVKTLNTPIHDSFEGLWREASVDNALLNLNYGLNGALRENLEAWRLQRMIGVIYRPETELASHYMDAAPALQYDHYVWFRNTTAVTPLPFVEEEGATETYPFGM